MRNARETREILRELLNEYPPSLASVLKLDPSLMMNPNYLAPYPKLSAFLSQHPEIAHNPGFFVGEAPTYREPSMEYRANETFKEVLAGLAAFSSGLIFLSGLGWVLKTIIDHRRWLRVAKVQSEVHSKLLDRFTSNQDLLAYIQTPAGRHFLESAPISLQPGPRSLNAPVGRILFSVQAGVVLAAAGVGLNAVSRFVTVQEIAQPLFIVSALALAVGIGFVVSAILAYVLSRQLGLLNHNNNTLASTSDNAGVTPPNA